MNTALFSDKRFQISFISMLILLSGFHAYYFFSINIFLNIAITDAILSEIILLLLCYILSNVLSYYMPGRTKQLFLLAWTAIIAVVWLGICWLVLFYYFQENTSYILFLKNTAPVRLFFGFLIITSVAFYNVLWQNQQYDAQIIQKDTETKELAKEAELFKLRQQMQPHFLFNSLNSINALITIDSKKARKMVNQLSDYLRITLKKEVNEFIFLKDEIDYLELYLEIEKIRFGHRLETVFAIQQETLNKKIPAMILQPLLENAIKFGLYNTTENVKIEVQSALVNNQLIVEIKNPFDAQINNQKIGEGFGLSAIARRLHLLYSRTDLLQVHKIENIFITKIILPI